MKNLALNKLLQKQITYDSLDNVLSDFRLWWPAVYGVDWDPERWVDASDASNNILDIFMDEIKAFHKLYDGDWKKNQKIDEWIKNIRKTTFDEIFSCSTDEPNPKSFGYEYGEHIEDHLFELFPTFTKARPNSSDFLSRRLDIIVSRTSMGSKRTAMTEGLFCDTSVIETIGLPVAVDLFKHLISVPDQICSLKKTRGPGPLETTWLEPDLERNLEVVEVLKCIERMPMSNLYIADHPIFHKRSTQLLTKFSNIGDRELDNSGSPKIVPRTGISVEGGRHAHNRYHACLSLIFNNVNMEIPFWLKWASGFCNSILYKSNFSNIKYLTEVNDLMFNDTEAQTEVAKGRLEGLFADSDIISSQAEIEIMAYWGKDKKKPLQVAHRSLFSDSRITFKNHKYEWDYDDVYQRSNNDGASLTYSFEIEKHASNRNSASYGYKGKPLTLVFRDCVFLNTVIDIAPGDEKYFKIKYENCIWP